MTEYLFEQRLTNFVLRIADHTISNPHAVLLAIRTSIQEEQPSEIKFNLFVNLLLLISSRDEKVSNLVLALTALLEENFVISSAQETLEESSQLLQLLEAWFAFNKAELVGEELDY